MHTHTHTHIYIYMHTHILSLSFSLARARAHLVPLVSTFSSLLTPSLIFPPRQVPMRRANKLSPISFSCFYLIVFMPPVFLYVGSSGCLWGHLSVSQHWGHNRRFLRACQECTQWRGKIMNSLSFSLCLLLLLSPYIYILYLFHLSVPPPTSSHHFTHRALIFCFPFIDDVWFNWFSVFSHPLYSSLP